MALRLCALALLSVGLLFAGSAAQATTTGTVVAWGCGGPGGGSGGGQCTVPTASGVTAIAAASIQSLALKQDGSVIAWGCDRFNDSGQCTVPAAAASGVTAVAAGLFHSLALKQFGSVIAWGCGGTTDYGQCTVPAAAASGVTAVAAAVFHSLALKQGGSVIAWGCGRGFDYGQCTVPAAAASGVTAIAASDYDSLALKQGGSVIAWGCGGSANLGQCTVPAAAASGVTAIAASLRHSLALKQDGSVIAWGCGDVDYGQCTVPAAAASGVTAIAAGEDYNLALKQDGSVLAWGCGSDNGINRDFGQCGVPSGLCDVTAIAAGTFHSLALAKACQTITFGALVGKTFGDSDFAVSASASSGLSVSISASGSCSVSAASVHITGAGSCMVTASQPGDPNYAAAPDVSQSFTIAKAGQSITFGALTNTTYGDPDFAVSASASSGLPVSISASGSCSVSAASVHITGAGSCTVTASQPGDPNYAAAPEVSQSFAIAKANQTTAFGALVGKTFGDSDVAVSASASSGLPVSFAASGSCTVSAASLHITGAGSCTVTASQPGDVNFAAAPDLSRSFAIAKANQTIAFGALANKAYGAPDFGVSATASSGLAVSFAASGSCTLSGATVHLTGAGSCTITASQAGDANHNAAPDGSQIFAIAPAPCTVPNVVGTQVASAKLTIATRHCRTGTVTYAYSRKHKKGTVISQTRRPGRVLPARAKIDLLVSRGRKR